MMYTMPKNLLSICVNFTLATQRRSELLRIFLTGTGKNGIIILLSGCSDSKCKVSSSVERSLPKPQRRVRFPYLAPITVAKTIFPAMSALRGAFFYLSALCNKKRHAWL